MKVAQLRKISILIEKVSLLICWIISILIEKVFLALSNSNLYLLSNNKARIDTKHEILEIGCGWGSFAIEVVKRTGCKYTGITRFEAQLEFVSQHENMW